MWDYIRKVIGEFPEEITGVCATPASDYLFKVRENGTKLNEELAEAFHHTFYCCKQSKTRYPNGSIIPHYASKKPRRR